MKKKSTLIVLLVLIAIVVLSNTIVITSADEYSVITEFGSIKTVYSAPGPSIKVPFVQSATKIPKYRMVSDLVPSDVTTKTKKS